MKTNHRSKITAAQLIETLRNKLNIVITDQEAQDLFNEWDKDRNGWLDVEEFVDIIMPKDIDEKVITYIGKEVLDYSTSISGSGTKVPPSAQQHTRMDNISMLSAEEMQTLIRDKIYSRLSVEGNCFQYQKMFKLFNDGERSRLISREKMRDKLVRMFGIDLPNADFEKFFNLVDKDHSGYIDTKEFLDFMIPQDYWNAGNMPWELTNSETYDIRPPEVSHASEDQQKDSNFHHMKEIPASLRGHKWTVDEIQQILWDKIAERMPIQGNCHQYQRIYRMFCEDLNKGLVPRKTMTKELLHDKLLNNFGIQVSEEDMDELFALYDTDGNGEIDIFEFIQALVPPDSNGRLPFQESGPLHDDLEPAMTIRPQDRFDPMAPEDPASLRKFKPDAEELEQRVREKVLGRSGGNAYSFKDMFVKLKAGMREAPELMGMINAKALQIILRTHFGITCDDEEIEMLWKRFDKDNVGKMPVRQLAAAFLPQDTDGTHHLTPKSNQDSQLGSEVRNHLFQLMGKTGPGSSLVGGSIGRKMEGGNFSRPSTAQSAVSSELTESMKRISTASKPESQNSVRIAKPQTPNSRLYQQTKAKGPYPVSWAARRPTSNSRWRRPASASTGRSPRKTRPINSNVGVPGLSISGQVKEQEDRSEIIGANRPMSANPTPRARARKKMEGFRRGPLDEAYSFRITYPPPKDFGPTGPMAATATRKLVSSPIKLDMRFKNFGNN